jgi:uncharacterized membrane protein
MDSLTKTGGRLIFGIPFLVFGIMHFVFGSGMNGLVPGFLPFPLFWVYFTGLALVAASISFMINKYVYHAGLGLALFLIVTALLVHLPMVLSGNMQPNFSAMLKDIMLAGGALYFAGEAQRNEL